MHLAPRPRLLAAAVLTAVLVPLTGTGPAAADDEPAAGDTVVGELVQAWAEHADPEEAAEHADDALLSWVTEDDGSSVRVDTEDVDDVPVGATVEVVLGAEVPDEAGTAEGLEPAREVVDAHVVAPAETALPAPASAPYTNEVTVVLVAPSGLSPDGTTAQQVVDQVNGPVADFWETQSDGAVRVHATAAQAGWLASGTACDSSGALWTDVARQLGWTRAPGKHLLLYVPGNRNDPNDPCAYGLAQVGTSRTSGGFLYVRGVETSVIAHELGHNFGLGHSSAVQCDGSPEGAPCRTQPYWDWYDVMGVSWDEVGSLNAPQAARLGLLPASAQVQVASSTPGGSWTLAPMGGRSGTRVLALTAADGSRYWVEYRTPVGQDAWLGDEWRNWVGVEAGVLVHETGPGPAGDTSLLLDGTPSAQSQWPADQQTVLPAGSRMTLGGSLTVSVTGTSASGAVVSVRTPADGSQPEATGAGTAVLIAGQELQAGQSLRSPSGEYRAVAQPDGNLVVYGAGERVLWHAHTHGNTGARTVVQADGNLVVYAPDGRALWNARTNGNPGARLQMQDDGNLVLYRADGAPAWWTGRDAFDVLRAGEQMARGQSLRSPSGEYRAVAQPDGNLVVYGAGERVLWHAHTHGNTGARTVVQADGNLVVYAPDGRALWNARTNGNPGARLQMQDDGNLVLYRADGAPAWWTGRDAFDVLRAGEQMARGQSLRSPSGEYRAVAQPDGNLVVYGAGERVLWHAHTHGNTGARTVVQADGNLVVYAPDGRALWNARTNGNPGARLQMQDDGNLVLYRADGRALWSSRFGPAS